MKKKNLSLLKLKKSKISNLNGLRSVIGGTGTIPPPSEHNPITEMTNCNQNTCTSVCQSITCTANTGCDTNDTLRSLGTTVFATVTTNYSNSEC